MKRLAPDIIDYYDNEIVKIISERYGLSPLDAFKLFANSKTHIMLENADCGMTDFGAKALLEIWECERATGDPRNSVYIKED